MSMRSLTKVLQGRITPQNRKRLDVHVERRKSALLLSKTQYANLLKSKAVEAEARPSAYPLVTITPEMAMAIAQHLQKKTR